MRDIREDQKRHMDILERCNADALTLSRAKDTFGLEYMTPAHRALLVNVLNELERRDMRIALLEQRLAKLDGMGGVSYEGAAG